MSKIDDMIACLCPNGVEYKTLEEFCLLERGKVITKKNAIEGLIPVISGGQQPAYYIDSFNREGVTITVAGSGAYAGHVMFWEKPIWVADSFSIKAKNENETLLKYVFYLLKNKQEKIYLLKRGSGVPHVKPSDLKLLMFPVPPIEIQEEIVRVLDFFTELEAELEAELERRKAQYAYYRDSLFNALGGQLVEMGEIVSYIQPSKYLAQKDEYSGVGNIPVLTAGKTFILGYTENEKNVYTASKEHPVILFDDFTTSSKWVDFPFKVKSSAAKILSCDNEKTLKYIYYVMQWLNFIPASHQRHWISIYSKIKIPYIPLEEQTKIVTMLDSLNDFCSSLEVGLPAEKKLRKQQYEYYRDKLLDLPRKAE